MNSKRSLRFFSNTLTAAGLALAVSACSTVYQDDWDQSTGVPDLNDPNKRSEALLAYCKKLHSRGDLNLAVGICNRSHEINPTDPAPLIQLARVLEDLEMEGPAEEAYRAALLLDPQQTDALYGLGKIYIDQQRYDQAVEPLEAAAQAGSEDPRIYNALGVIMDQQGQHAAAQDYYQEGLDHSPRNISLRNNLGLSMVLGGQPEAGLAMLRDVAAEPAAGATTGRNLEMASQIAAQSVLSESSADAETGSEIDVEADAGEGDRVEAAQQAVTSEPVQPAVTNEPAPTQELASLSPSASRDETGDATKDDASEPMALLDPYAKRDRNAASNPPRAPRPMATQHYDRSLDQELAEAMTPQPEAAEEIEAAEAPRPDIAEATPPEPTAGSESAPQAAPQMAALPAPELTVDEEIHTARDWAFATQTAFAASRADVAEPAQISTRDRLAANDSFHAAPAPDAGQDDVPIVPASTAGAATAGSYGIDADVFYTAQLASFRSAERARAGWQILKDSAGDLLAQSDAHIVRADLGPELGVYYRVRTGSMSDRAAAAQFCQDLQTQGLDCMPVEASLQETNETMVEKICDTASNGALCGTDENSSSQDPRPPHIRG